MNNSSCCRDKGYYEKWHTLKHRLNEMIVFGAIKGQSAENNEIILRYETVISEMEKMEENAN